jgi:hypothetical protein
MLERDRPSTSYVTDPEHRFFFALLLNIEDRDTIFVLIGSRFRS